MISPTNKVKLVSTGIEGLLVVECKAFGDARGFFTETFNAQDFAEHGLPVNFVQDNYSRSAQGVLRGLHFQDPKAQGKLVRCNRGSVWDVALDIRKGSATYGKHFGLELSEENKLALWIPPGFAHGFCVLSEIADFFYKCTEMYTPANEKGLLWNDPALNISWPIKDPKLSDRDTKWSSFKDFRP